MGGLPPRLHERLERINVWLVQIQNELVAIRKEDPEHPAHMAIHGWGRRDDGSIGLLGEGCRSVCEMCNGGKAASPDSPCPVCGRTGTEKRRGD